MYVLGLHIGHKKIFDENRSVWGPHDTAVALIGPDGEIIAAIEEERLNRVKHSNFFPLDSINYCLEIGNLKLKDVDLFAFPTSAETSNYLSMLNYWKKSDVSHMTSDAQLNAIFQSEFNCDIRGKIRYSEHHEAHAWSAFAVSGYKEAMVVVFDGDGENNTSGLIGVGTRSGIEVIKRFTAPTQSLGGFYQHLIHFVGYHRFDEYKVMGLAPYGNPSRFRAHFDRLCRLKPNGDYSIELDKLSKFLEQEGLFKDIRRETGKFRQVHMDYCAALQESVERTIMHVIRHYRKELGLRNLCLAGGVGHNCSANGKIYYSGLFDSVYFQPVAHDAGLSFGAALHVLSKEKSRVIGKPMRRLDLGKPISENIVSELVGWAEVIDIEQVEDVGKKAASMIAEGEVLGWVQGRSEFGPRALGYRSIIADPSPASNKDRINYMIKKREGYRPFAPSVLQGSLSELFELSECESKTFPFMISTLRVREIWQEKLAAVTHVDGTARVQSVCESMAPRYWRLINEFKKLTGIPAVLNTSLNNNVEPIVETIDDAISCFLTTGLSRLVVGDFVISKKSNSIETAALGSLVVTLPANRYLVKKGDTHAIYTTSHRWLGQGDIEISAELFTLLIRCNHESTLARLCKDCRVSLTEIVPELVQVWELRAVALRPLLVSAGSSGSTLISAASNH